ncbi:MAG: DUF262 domain-containing protein [Phycisphaeraceae bacterium]
MSRLLSVSDIFRDRIFRIPDYQRGYSWTRVNLDDFWNDVADLSDTHVHYMGVISVEQPRSNQLLSWEKESPLFSSCNWRSDGDSALLHLNGQSLRPYYIIDGQQRLLTIAILLSCLNRGGWLPPDASAMLRGYLWQPCKDDQCYRLGYEVDIPSHHYLIHEVYNNGKSDEITTAYTKNLGRAKEFFADKINWHADECERRSIDLLRTLTEQLRFNFYEVDKSIDVCVVFETMNNRGTPLSRLELLKNRLLYLSTQLGGDDTEVRARLRDSINRDWKEIYAWLAKDEQKPALDDDDFLRAHWIMYFEHAGDTGRHIRTSDFARDLLTMRFNVTRARAGELTACEIERYVASLRESVRWWFAINNPLHPTAGLGPIVRTWVQRIHQVKGNKSYFRPLVMALLQRRDLSEEEQAAVLQAIERHEFLLGHLVGSRATANRPHFWRKAGEVFRNEENVSDTISDIRSKTQRFYNQPKVADNIKRWYAKYPREDGGWARWSGLRYFLQQYDASLDVDDAVPRASVAIEHILPQRRQRGPSWSADFDSHSKARRDLLCSTIGNLVLKSTDRFEDVHDAGYPEREPHSFDEKRRRFRQGTASQREVAEYPQWRHRDILGRGVQLLGFMAKHWDILLSEDFRKQLTQVNFDGETN